MKKMLALALASASLILTCCSATPRTGVKSGEGQASAQPSATSVEPSASTMGEVTEDQVATFEQRYTYEDGVRVEVTQIQHGRVTRADARFTGPDASAGAPYVVLTIRVTNGSKKQLDVYNSSTLTYGPDGKEASSPYLVSVGEESSISGKLLPGRVKVATEVFIVPAKYQDDPILEFTFSAEHQAAIFSGALR